MVTERIWSNKQLHSELDVDGHSILHRDINRCGLSAFVLSISGDPQQLYKDSIKSPKGKSLTFLSTPSPGICSDFSQSMICVVLGHDYLSL